MGVNVNTSYEDIEIDHYSELSHINELKAAVLGEQIKIFFNGPIGQYVLTCAQADEKKIRDQLVSVDYRDSDKILKLQMEAVAVTKAVKYLIFKMQEAAMIKKTLEENNYGS